MEERRPAATGEGERPDSESLVVARSPDRATRRDRTSPELRETCGPHMARSGDRATTERPDSESRATSRTLMEQVAEFLPQALEHARLRHAHGARAHGQFGADV